MARQSWCKPETTVFNVLYVFFRLWKAIADQRLFLATMHSTTVVWGQLSARNVHRIIKFIASFINSDNPDTPVGQISLQLFQITMLLESNILYYCNINSLAAITARMAFSFPFHRLIHFLFFRDEVFFAEYSTVTVV